MSEAAATAPGRPAFDIAAAIALEEIAPDRFTAVATGGQLVRPFGGHILAIALGAAQRTAPEGRRAASTHSYFVRGARIDRPFDLRIERDSDGRSFSHRRVFLEQDGRLILTLSAMFQERAEGAEQQAAMPDVPAPETLAPQDAIIADALAGMPPHRSVFWDRDIGIDFRSVEPFHTYDPPPRPARQNFWFRIKRQLSDDPAEHQRMLAYASDFYLMHTGLMPLAIGWCDPDLQDVSLDHAMWFHRPFRADDWLLYAMDSPFSGGARTLARGSFFTRDGMLVASVAQEGLIRLTSGRIEPVEKAQP